MQEKSNKGLIWLIVILIALVLGLSGFILYREFYDKDKTDIDSKITTKIETTTKALEKGQNNFTLKLDDINLKLEEKKLYQNGDDYNLDYDKFNFSDVVANYNVESDNYKIRIEYKDGYNKFYINDKEVGNIASFDLYVLHSLMVYKNNVIVRLACACDVSPRNFAIDLKNKKIIEYACFPDSNGECKDYSYDYVNNDIYEIEFAMNYNNKITKDILSKQKIECNESAYYEGCNGDATCERWVSECFKP